MQLHEQYRPTTWAELVGQEKAVAKIDQLRARGLGGRAYWITGQSGTGKTTTARLLAAEIASPDCIEEFDAGDLTAQRVRDIERSMCYFAFGKGGKTYIVNEAHGLRTDIVRQLLVLLEPIPQHVMFVFTTAIEGEMALFDGCEDTSPLLSRCTKLELSRRGLAEPFAQRVAEIAQRENLNGQPIEKYVTLAKQCRNNMRAMLQSVEAGDMVAK